ncbi:C40 family peptidase [Lentzea flaviverrucosa]|uniref:Cell wall-associated hydrolase, NlpC family n=1 Tax=Lentzea flaviverrucosa TaxID=200379 RepID=A0A1H9JWD3_9PSEU|nr:C40 family peptidase [Lentzea flaviverrucosa]RDI26657.1 cell wall-associated NlpC family hydrolase [Lentzea flaviverrucosa]SEQ91168.1 Cell wall-associated hydrolase, NlpC family [Lentzea flaviverrucosa]
MVSQPSRRIVRGALVATAAVVAAALPTAPATAQPNAADALKKFNELSEQASKLNQDHLKAQEDLKAKQGELDKAKGDLANAQKAEESLRGQVDLLTEATNSGANFSQISALLVSDSQQDFLNRMSAINILAADNADALQKLTDAVNAADAATKSANEATETSKKLLAEMDQKKADLDKQLAEATTQYRSLSNTVKNQLAASGDMSNISVPAGTAGRALQFALGERGKPYVYGSNGPNSWDCSSLIQAAYRAAGVSIGRTSYAQAAAGRPVSRGEVKAGDILVYYSSQSHVAMAVDGIRAVHASTEGQPVKIADIDSIGPISGIRRIEG